MLQIIHRRLGVRNVLLQHQANGLVAKLIGFGPLAEDMDRISDVSDQSGAGVSLTLFIDSITIMMMNMMIIIIINDNNNNN